MFICSDSGLEAAEGIDPSLCLVCLGSGICPDPPPLAGRNFRRPARCGARPLLSSERNIPSQRRVCVLRMSIHLRTVLWVSAATLTHLVGSHVLIDGQAGWFTVTWVIQQVGQIPACVCQLQLLASLRTPLP